MWYKDGSAKIYCVNTDVISCGSSIYLPTQDAVSTSAEIYGKYGWCISSGWNDDDWDGIAFCPKHEDEAMEWLSED